MAEIEILLPTVQYGNVKVRATPEELGLASLADAYDVGVASAVYLNVFTQGFKKGATLDVATRGEPDPTEAARRHIESELGSTTELSDDGQNEDAKPWDKPVAEAKKPWEVDEVTAPAVLEALGDGW